MTVLNNQQLTALRSATTGPLKWQVPKGIHPQLDHSRFGEATEGFSIFFPNVPQGIKNKIAPITPDKAIEIADYLDTLGGLEHSTPNRGGDGPAGRWVRQIIDLLPDALKLAIEDNDRRGDRLAELRRQARRA